MIDGIFTKRTVLLIFFVVKKIIKNMDYFIGQIGMIPIFGELEFTPEMTVVTRKVITISTPSLENHGDIWPHHMGTLTNTSKPWVV